MSKLLKIVVEEIEKAKENTNNNSVTYDEGNGVKETVVMTGPLSNVYTQALNIYFAKKDINEPDIKGEKSESVSLAKESIQIDKVIINALKDKLKDEDKEVFDHYNLVSDNTDIDTTPDVIINATDFGSSNKPEIIDLVQKQNEMFGSSNKDYILFIGPDVEDSITTQVCDTEKEKNAFNSGDQFKTATESFYTTLGIKVAVGFESLSKVLLERLEAKRKTGSL